MTVASGDEEINKAGRLIGQFNAHQNESASFLDVYMSSSGVHDRCVTPLIGVDHAIYHHRSTPRHFDRSLFGARLWSDDRHESSGDSQRENQTGLRS
jgi:hypothetical protein